MWFRLKSWKNRKNGLAYKGYAITHLGFFWDKSEVTTLTPLTYVFFLCFPVWFSNLGSDLSTAVMAGNGTF